MHRYEYPDILACAEMLHEHTTGSGDPMRVDVEDKVVEFLNMRLREWQKTVHAGSLQYDEAVRNLVRAAIDEYMSSHWMKEKVRSLSPGLTCECNNTSFYIYSDTSGFSYRCTSCGRSRSSTAAIKIG